MQPDWLESIRNRSPLCLAVDRENFDEVHRLISGGADASQPDCSENTPLFLAQRSYKMVEFLLQHGADPRIYPGVYAEPITQLCSPESPLGRLLARYGYEATGTSNVLDDVAEAT